MGAQARYALAAGAKMWTAAKRAASGLPTARSALKFTGGMFGFSLLCSKIQGHNHNSAHWAGDLKKKTRSSEFDVKDGETSKTKTKEIYFRTDPETGYRYPVGVIGFNQSNLMRPDGKTRRGKLFRRIFSSPNSSGCVISQIIIFEISGSVVLTLSSIHRIW